MQLKQLQFFVVSVDMGSFKAAADVLYTSQPHISKTIKALEEELNMSLLNRQATGVVMTEEGRKVYEYANRILRNVEMISNLQEENQLEKFSISSNPSYKLTKIYASFYQEKETLPVRFQYLEGTVEEVMQHLHKHRSEIGFVFISERQYFAFQEVLGHRRLEFRMLKKTEPYLYVGPQHPLYKAQGVDEQQLKEMKLVQMREDFFSLTSHLGHLKNELGAYEKLPKAVVTDSDHVLMQFLTNTKLANIGSSMLQGKYEYNNIHGIPITSGIDSIYFGYIKRRRDELSPIAEEFVGYLKNIIH